MPKKIQSPLFEVRAAAEYGAQSEEAAGARACCVMLLIPRSRAAWRLELTEPSRVSRCTLTGPSGVGGMITVSVLGHRFAKSTERFEFHDGVCSESIDLYLSDWDKFTAAGCADVIEIVASLDLQRPRLLAVQGPPFAPAAAAAAAAFAVMAQQAR
jgi:hypothetical protein